MKSSPSPAPMPVIGARELEGLADGVAVDRVGARDPDQQDARRFEAGDQLRGSRGGGHGAEARELDVGLVGVEATLVLEA